MDDVGTLIFLNRAEDPGKKNPSLDFRAARTMRERLSSFYFFFFGRPEQARKNFIACPRLYVFVEGQKGFTMGKSLQTFKAKSVV